ncbi:uncharacterized protein LOC124500236 [Dermatophagoides farinae]|uniref:uncharacterized protein LOC124500236 n=1 Tax=Dermatophagoides farinae TaxID=6954 RepID=UPI003F62157A
MQQHSQIIELKDRLVQALDEQSNVKDINEVNRIISILERTHVTREDLEITRLGKYINGLRKKTTDKELAKRAKKLIKTWRDLTVGGSNHSTSSNNISTLTSPFNSNSISPHGSVKAYYDSKLTPPPSSNQHPALLRVKTQHGSLTTLNEKSKIYGRSLSPTVSPSNSINHSRLNVSVRPQTQTQQIASPKNATESTNGHKSPSLKSHQQQIKKSNLTPPPFTNGISSPGIQNFKNLFTKETTVSLKAEYRRRTTPPIQAYSDSAISSQHCSPNTFSNDSRDSFGHNNHKNSYSNQHGSSNFDFHDDDSNSSQLSNLSNDCSAKSDECSSSKRTYRKRKLEENENDSLRENFNYVMSYGGRRPQSTQELIEKLNVNLSPKILKKHNDLKTSSFSASSSPCIPPLLTKDSSLDLKKINITNSNSNTYYRNGYHKKRNGFHSEENSLDSFDKTILHNKLIQVRRSHNVVDDDDDEDVRENSISPDSSKFCDLYAGDEDEDDEDSNDDYDDDEVDANITTKSKKSSHDSNFSSSKSREFDRLFNHAQKIDQEIRDIYSKLPKVNPEDLKFMQQFCFDNDDDIINAENETTEQQQQTTEADDEEFIEEYEVGEQDRQQTVTSSSSSSPNNNDKETSFLYQTNNSKCDISNCDNNIVDEEKSFHDDHYDGDGDERQSSLFDQQENSINSTNNNDDDGESKKKLVKLIIRKRRRKPQQQRQSSSNDDEQKRIVTLIDRLANEQWEGFNGNYDKDGVWHDFSEMTSSYVLTGGDENYQTEENILHILPYVNCTW